MRIAVGVGQRHGQRVGGVCLDAASSRSSVATIICAGLSGGTGANQRLL